MARIRKNVHKLGPGWNGTLLWYARGVAALQARPVRDPTSWRYLAAMHGFDPDLWAAFGYIGDADELPRQADQDRDWMQCQHQSWYFIPWHRGYLHAFEEIVAAAVVAAGGPADWALPYWNYSDADDPSALKLPDAFGLDTMPDGKPNPLKVDRRYGNGSGTVVIRARDVDLRSALLRASHYTGGETGGSPGFGGPDTPFTHSGDTNGMLESQPHNGVHVRVGGRDPNDGSPGLMTDPDTAALDPIFWVHHANIDRLWDVWLTRDPRHRNERGTRWLNGPTDRAFSMPLVDGTSKGYAPKDMLSTQTLGYSYDDTSDPFGGTSLVAMRMERLGAAPSIVAASATGAPAVSAPKPAELVGANSAAIQLDGTPKDTQLKLDPAPRKAIAHSFAMGVAPGAAPPKQPDHVFLNLENIRGVNDSAMFDVYVGLAPGADPEAHSQNLAGTISFFGVRKATRSDGAHGGNGINEVLDITHVVDALHLSGNLDVEHLNVRFVPSTQVGPDDKISVGRVSVYRQSQ